MKPKYLIVILLFALIGSNLYLLYALFDQGVSLMYTTDSLGRARRQYEQTVILANLNLTGLSSKEAIEKIGEDIYEQNPFIKEGCIWASQVCVRLEDDKVVRIEHVP